jgi:protocatechuate 3,4-dioxygenase alpha subunit
MADQLGLTPSQTVGPFLHLVLAWPDGADAAPEGTPGAAWVSGALLDGAGVPVSDGLIETWQADLDGRYEHPDDPRGPGHRPPGFRGFGRSATDRAGRWSVRIVKPGATVGADGATEAPHLDVSVFARGLLSRLVTRIYFADEPDANAADPLLSSLPANRRATLIAPRTEDGYHFDIHLQGESETVFLDV